MNLALTSPAMAGGARRGAGLFEAAKRVVPRPARRVLRRLVDEIPQRLRDAGPDIAEWIRRDPRRLPPAGLRQRVGIGSSRAQFVAVGSDVAREVLQAYDAVAGNGAAEGKWLDFGCGSGRVSRNFESRPGLECWGVDVDRDAVGWMKRNVDAERFAVCGSLPPLAFADQTFDVVLSVSVFTHLNERSQMAWLAEVSRVLKSGGLLIASTHGPDLLWTRPDLKREEHETFETRGFVFVGGDARFNDDTAFHRSDYMDSSWGSVFRKALEIPKGLRGYQDLSVWRKPQD